MPSRLKAPSIVRRKLSNGIDVWIAPWHTLPIVNTHLVIGAGTGDDPEGKSGLELIATLRSAFGGEIAAFLISGDTSPDRIREVRSSGLHLLYKPVTPMALRAMLVRYLKMGRVSIAPDIRSQQLTV